MTRPLCPILLLASLGATAGAEPRLDRYGDPLPPGAVARLGSTALRTTASLLVLSPDGKNLLTAAAGRTIGRWDAETGRLRDETHLPGLPSEEAWLAPDGKTLAVADGEGVGLWDTASGKRRRLLPRQAQHAAFSPDGRTLATADYEKSKGRVRLWDLETGRDRFLEYLPSYANDLAFSPDGKLLFAAVDNHSLRCWDAASGKQLWQNDHWASHLTVSPDGRKLCTDSYQGNGLRLWDAATGRPLKSPPAEKRWTTHLAFAPDGRTVAEAANTGVILWDVESGKALHRWPEAGMTVAFAPDGKSLFTLGPLLGRWDVTTGKALYPDMRDRGHVGPVAALTFAPDGRALATLGSDGSVRLWERASGRHRILIGEGTFHFRAGPVLGFTPDGKGLLTSVPGGILGLLDVATGKEVRRFRLSVKDRIGQGVATARPTADGRTVLALGAAMLDIRSTIDLDPHETFTAWDAATGKEVSSRSVSCSWPSGSVFSPDGRLLATPAPGSLVDLRSGEKRPFHDRTEGFGPPLAFSDDGRLLAAAEPGFLFGPTTAVSVYEVLTSRRLVRIEAPLGRCTALAFSPDGRLLLAPGTDALHVWEATTGKPLLRVEAKGRLTNWTPAGFATCLAVSPDSGVVATGHADGTVLLWDLAARERLTPPAAKKKPEAYWDDLKAPDAPAAYMAIETLAAMPAESLPLLRQRLRPTEIDPRWLAQQLEDLDSSDFDTREAASRDLGDVVEVVEAELRAAMKNTESGEVRGRLRRILEATRPAVPAAETLRHLRALTALERIGSEEAKEVLRRLARGTAEAPVTREAKATLERLKRGRAAP